MSLLPVDEAVARMLADAGPAGVEEVALSAAHGRVLATDLSATRTQPPFDASAMDGYAVRAADLATLPVELEVIGTAPAGRAFAGAVGPGQAVRIFTGAPVPAGADAILIQENTEPAGPGRVRALVPVSAGRHIRRAGVDFTAGQMGLKAGTRLDFRALSLAAAMNHGQVAVVRRPLVAILATGDELVPPGSPVGPDQIVASNHVGIAALVERAGGVALDLGIAADDRQAIAGRIRAAREAGADIIVTLGGASVGDHDLVKPVLEAEGCILDFWKIAMRPGKPLMFGRLGGARVLGLPGNPVSSLVTGLLFLTPLVRALAGGGRAPVADQAAVLGADVAENDGRRDYLRATLSLDGEGRRVATPLTKQDSSLLSVLARADALLVREVRAPAARAGDPCRIIPFS
ncbi:molybdopterin molybdotransferase MoeA [Segnochrobactraceae bacterium EtOH-i3]